MGRKDSKRDIDRHQASLFDEILPSIPTEIESEFVFNEPKTSVSPAVQKPTSNDINELKSVEKHNSFRFISFGSGSSGNCAYIGSDQGGILIDAGIEMKSVFDTLQKHGISPEMVKGVCLTHDHGDHIRYAYTIVRKYKHIHIYCTNRVLNGILRRHNISRRIKEQHVAIYKEIAFELAGLKITAFEVPHDGSDNAGFFIEYGDLKFAVATDIGHISERAYHYLVQAQFMMLESNYDLEMLRNGSYPEYLKNRIIASTGHLDNCDAARFLCDNYSDALKYVFLCHLSHDNNTPEKARKEIIDTLATRNITVGEGCDTIDDRKCDLQLVALPRFDPSRWYLLR
ncbi:MAG: MBL fold metallo-hydrolase [Muribaculaceae bacterium]|nr:MBL fold metallo-hydrolase [Muribaculaceae bacterium]